MSMKPLDVVRDGSLHTVTISRNYGSTRYVVNGIAVASEGGTVTVEGLPRIEMQHARSRTTRYVSLEAGLPDMSPAEWNAVVDPILGRRVPAGGDDDQGYLFATGEDKTLFDRMERAYTRESETVWVKVADIDIAVHDLAPESPFIVPGRFLGQGYTSPVVAYDRKGFVVDALVRAAQAAGLHRTGSTQELKAGHSFMVFDHSNEVSIHLPGGYMRKINVHSVQDTMERVSTLRDSDAATVERWISDWTNLAERRLPVVEVSEALDDAIARLRRLDVKASAISDRGEILGRLLTLRESLAEAPAVEPAPAPGRAPR